WHPAWMFTPAAVIPPTEEAVLAYRTSFKAEREKHGSMRMNPHAPKRAAAEVVLKIKPDLSFDLAFALALAHQATTRASQAHWNAAKSAVDRPWKRSFLGYSMTYHMKPRLRVAAKSVGRLRDKLRATFRQGRG